MKVSTTPRWAMALSALAAVGCQEVPAEAPAVSRADELRQRGAELVRGAPAAPPVEVSHEPLTAAEAADVGALAAALTGQVDPVSEALAAVDAAVERDLPVRAAELLRAQALPACRTLVATAEAIEVGTDLGAALRQQLVAAHTLRAAALEAYAGALERGIVEDLVLADALRDQRVAGQALVDARAALAAAQRRIDASAEGE